MRANQSCIGFRDIAAAALGCERALLPELVPNGRFERNEYVALNPSRADKNLGSFKINSRTGLWEDFATKMKGNDVIGWYAHAYGLKQGEAARQIAEKLGVSTFKGNGAKGDSPEPHPKIFSWGEMGPPVGRDEIRRHSYPKNGTPKLKLKIKSRGVPKDKWANCYRVFRDGASVGWQWEKPKDYRETPYFGAVRDPKQIFWPEGEKDTDTLDGLNLPVFTFGGGGDCLPDGVDHYLKLVTGRLLIIPTDNDAPGRKHAQEKAKLAHSYGVERIRVFDPKAEWPECPEGGDITDWFEKGGGTRDRLLEIIDTLPDWQPSANDDDTLTADDDAGPSWDYPDRSLLNDRRGDLPAFPLDVLSPRWQDWSRNSAHGAGTAIDYVVVPLLGFASGLIGTARRLKASASWSQPFTLWTAQLGYSGAGKTPGMDVSQRALARVERNRKHLIGELRRAHETKIENAKAANKHWKDRSQRSC